MVLSKLAGIQFKTILNSSKIVQNGKLINDFQVKFYLSINYNLESEKCIF